MRLEEIYKALCDIYGIEERLDIERFVVLVRASSDAHEVGSRVPSRESLLVRQSEGALELGLYIAPEIVAALEDDPLEHLDEFACAVEGASHFLYLTDRADKGVAVSQLELELQAEVDKFILIHLLAAGRCRAVPFELFSRQFEGYALDPSLGQSERERYEAASRFAAKYCARLRRLFFNPLKPAELAASARAFFNLGLREKVALITP